MFQRVFHKKQLILWIAQRGSLPCPCVMIQLHTWEGQLYIIDIANLSPNKWQGCGNDVPQLVNWPTGVGLAAGDCSGLAWASKRGWPGFGRQARPAWLAGAQDLALAHLLFSGTAMLPEQLIALPDCLLPAVAASLSLSSQILQKTRGMSCNSILLGHCCYLVTRLLKHQFFIIIII